MDNIFEAKNIMDCIYTAREYLEDVRRIEQCPFITNSMIIGDISEERLDEVYTVRLIRSDPAFPAYVRDCEDLSLADVMRWVNILCEMFKQRKFYDASLIKYVSDRNDINHIISLIDGNMVAYEACKLESYDCTIMHRMAYYILSEPDKLKRSMKSTCYPKEFMDDWSYVISLKFYDNDETCYIWKPGFMMDFAPGISYDYQKSVIDSFYSQMESDKHIVIIP